tara:strand:+ start:345 stop:509 length:165 start_codon:yes stop_codon:yes gene_type:complete
MEDLVYSYEDVLEIVYTLNDTHIDALLTALHEDLGREASLYCEVCNSKKGESDG